MNRLFISIFSFILFVTSFHLVEGREPYTEKVDECTLPILTPSFSDRKTAKIELRNGLNVYLISDPKAPQSAASFSMKVGSFSDPDDALGMAHFVEHLLFLGSKRYPEEHGYRHWIDDHGGKCNAYTKADRTVYSFSIDHKALPQALSRFAANFIAPLFSSSGIEREIGAIEQENDKNRGVESRRMLNVLKETANSNHPISRFSTGNRETLSKIDRKRAIKWYETHYSADLASLVVYSPLPLNKLKQLVVKNFSKMPTRETTPCCVKKPIFSSKQMGGLIVIEPVNSTTRKLIIEWELPATYTLDRTDYSADLLISYLLESYHSGSLVHQLKEGGWITSINAHYNKYIGCNRLFSVEFDLTPKGVDDFETVIQRLYDYLHFIGQRPIPPFLFEEIEAMNRLNYSYQERRSPFLYVQECADLLMTMDLASFPNECIFIKPFDEREKQAFLSSLTPEKGCYTLIASKQATPIDLDRKEKWFGVEYALNPLDKETLSKWKTPTRESFSEIEKSPFVPENLSLLPVDSSHAKEDPKPICLADNDHGKAYFWQDDRYLVPKVSFLIRLRSKALDGSIKSVVLRDLFYQAVIREILPSLYQAERAKLSATCKRGLFDLTFKISGYSDKATDLLETVCQAVASLELSKKLFQKCCLQLEDEYAKGRWSDTTLPVIQAIDLAKDALHRYPLYMKKEEALQELTFDDLLEFKRTLFKTTYIEALFAGNLTQEDATFAWEKVMDALSGDPYPQKEHKKNDLLLLSKAAHPYKIAHRSEAIGDAAVLVLEESPFSFQSAASAGILSKVLKQAFFDKLRTEKQMAYLLRADTSYYEDDQYLAWFLIQSTSHKSQELLFQMDAFLDDFVTHFDKRFSKKHFDKIRTACIHELKAPIPNLVEISEYLFTFGFGREGDFMRREKVVAALEALSYEEIKEYAMTYLSKENRSRLAVTVDGRSPDGSYTPITLPKLKELILPAS